MMRTADESGRTASAFLWPLCIWAVHLGFVYGSAGLGCARTWPAEVIEFLVGVATVAALAGCAVFTAWAAWRRSTGADERRFYATLEIGLGALSFIAIAWTGLSILIVPACGV